METMECTYASWAQRHATMFVFGAAGQAALQTWLPVLKRAGYRPDELYAATDWLALHEPPQYPADHLPALHRAIREVRALDVTPDDPWQRSSCVRCGDTGRLAVPHLRCVEGGVWRPLRLARGAVCYYTQAVRCDCARGRFGHYDLWKGDGTLQGLDDYERRNPGWREQLASRRREQAAEHESREPEWKRYRHALDDTLDRLRRQYQREPGQEG